MMLITIYIYIIYIYSEFNEEVIDKDPNLKLVILLEYQNTKTFLPKDILQIGLKKLL